MSGRRIYTFHDSRGRALYAGKAIKLGLWVEMINAYNRDREVQTVRRMAHPTKHGTFGGADRQRKSLAYTTLQPASARTMWPMA